MVAAKNKAEAEAENENDNDNDNTAVCVRRRRPPGKHEPCPRTHSVAGVRARHGGGHRAAREARGRTAACAGACGDAH